MIVGKSENDRPVAPGPPLNSVSPENSTPSDSRYRQTPPGEWPGVWITRSLAPATSNVCPSRKGMSGPRAT